MILVLVVTSTSSYMKYNVFRLGLQCWCQIAQPQLVLGVGM